MDRALREFRIRGVASNLQFLENVIAHPQFRSGECITRFIDDTPELFQFQKRRDRATRLLRINNLVPLRARDRAMLVGVGLDQARIDGKAFTAESLGAERAINYRTEDFVARVKDLTAGRGVDVVIGRSRSCDISLRRCAIYLKTPPAQRDNDHDFNTVSRRHCELMIVIPRRSRGLPHLKKVRVEVLDAQRLAREALFFMVWSAPREIRQGTLAALFDA